jgi:hypothetical protein
MLAEAASAVFSATYQFLTRGWVYFLNQRPAAVFPNFSSATPDSLSSYVTP